MHSGQDAKQLHEELTYAYDAAGNKAMESLPPDGAFAALTTTYTYDDLNRLIQLTTMQASSTTPVLQETYILNLDGSPASESGAGAGQTYQWNYDPDGRLVMRMGDLGVYTYGYDLVGNRVSDTVPAGSSTDMDIYTYDARNEQTGQSTYNVDYTDSGVEYDLLSTVADMYDANGSLTSSVLTPVSGSATTTTYGYDVRNKLTTVSVNGNLQATYLYDDNGNRVQETVGSTTTFYLTDHANPTGYAQPVEEWSSGGGSRSLVRTYFIGQRVFGQWDSSDGVLLLLADGHGSTVAYLDSAGDETGLTYDPFGDRKGVGFP